MQRTIAAYTLSVVLIVAGSASRTGAQEANTSASQKSQPVSVAELADLTTTGVTAVEVHDYAPVTTPGR